jgi:hypothetical protein
MIEKEWEYKGISCQVKIHTGLGFRCGYVGIPKEHKLYNVDYNEIYEKGYDLEVHGGLTFANKIKDSDLWWLGYDCGHSGDAQDPDLIKDERCREIAKSMPVGPMEKARDLDYCIKECEFLAEQLIKI